MVNLVLLASCFLMGIFLRKTGRFPANTPPVLNGFVIYVSLPALTLFHIHKLQMAPGLVLTALMPWLLFGLGFLYFRFIGKWAGLPLGSIGALLLVGGLGNTSFVGLPMIEAFFGKEYLGVGIIADQLGSFLVLSTFGVLVATVYSSGGCSPREMARKILLFPPFQALVLAFILRPVPFPDLVNQLLQKLGDTLTPLALASVGFQLRLNQFRGELKALAVGLGYKLILGPALMALIFVAVLGGSGGVVQVTLFEAAMAPMISAGIIAIDHELNPTLVTLMIGVGIPLSFLTLTGWWWLLHGM